MAYTTRNFSDDVIHNRLWNIPARDKELANKIVHNTLANLSSTEQNLADEIIHNQIEQITEVSMTDSFTWTPASEDFYSTIGYWMDGNPLGLTSITCLLTNSIGGFYFDGEDEQGHYDDLLTSIRFPYLIDVDPTGIMEGDICIEDWNNLTTLEFPVLRTVNDGFEVYYCSSLVNINLSNLIDPGYIDIDQNEKLENINLSSYVPQNDSYSYFYGNAFSQECVDNILYRYVLNADFVEGYIDLSGGTNQPPSSTGQGYIDTLNARAVAHGTTINIYVNSVSPNP